MDQLENIPNHLMRESYYKDDEGFNFSATEFS